MVLQCGDSVMYQDKDHVQWGPWVVIGVSGDRAIVQIESEMSYSIPMVLLQKVVHEHVLN
jgi:hypothetical protein